jgi:hypothetical protein
MVSILIHGTVKDLVIQPMGCIKQQLTDIHRPIMLISLTINQIADQQPNEQMSALRFETGSFMTEREHSTN